MPAKESEAKAIATNTSLDRQNPHLIQMGAVHDPALNGKPHPDWNGMWCELTYLGITTTGVPKSEAGLKNTSLFSATNGNVNARLPTHAKSTAGYVAVWQGQSPRSEPSFEKHSMQFWRAESASDQPWNGLALGQSGAYTGPKKN